MTAPDTIVLIHGLWMTPLSWEHWIDRYTRQGYRVLAPSWPGLEGGVEALRRDPSPLAGLGVAQVADHYERIISDLPTRPIIMGHSFGGLLTQLMLDRGLGAAGVAIHSGQVRGVYRLPFTQLKAASPVLGNPANRNRAVPFTHEQFHYAFTNTLSAQRSRRRTTATTCPPPRGCCSRARSRTWTRGRRWPSTYAAPTARRCCSSRAVPTTSCPPR
ncbi:alpha/beta hydrolase [Catellatospora bangladeshensis]|uniref:alpha/beta hydrolase n=1 Tax=Catellatospora bangladeshensis TaxID=310355 RepID=UPI003608B409